MKKYLILIAIVLVISGVVGIVSVNANQQSFVTKVTNDATSTVGAVTPATSQTIQLDAYANGMTKAFDSAVLLSNIAPSTTTSAVKIAINYSMDGIDWFSDNFSTTSPKVLTQEGNFYTITGTSTSATNKVTINVPVPTRYIRVTFSSLSATSTVWAELVAKRQIN